MCGRHVIHMLAADSVMRVLVGKDRRVTSTQTGSLVPCRRWVYLWSKCFVVPKEGRCLERRHAGGAGTCCTKGQMVPGSSSSIEVMGLMLWLLVLSTLVGGRRLLEVPCPGTSLPVFLWPLGKLLQTQACMRRAFTEGCKVVMRPIFGLMPSAGFPFGSSIRPARRARAANQGAASDTSISRPYQSQLAFGSTDSPCHSQPTTRCRRTGPRHNGSTRQATPQVSKQTSLAAPAFPANRTATHLKNAQNANGCCAVRAVHRQLKLGASQKNG